MSSVKDLIKGFTPQGIAEGLIGKVADGAKDVITNVQNNRMTIEQGLQELEKIKIQAQQDSKKEITARWQSDMKSDSWLSKNVRPLVLMYMVFCTTLLVFIDAGVISFDVKSNWIDLLQLVLMTVIAAYFGGRSYEKAKS